MHPLLLKCPGNHQNTNDIKKQDFILHIYITSSSHYCLLTKELAMFLYDYFFPSTAKHVSHLQSSFPQNTGSQPKKYHALNNKKRSARSKSHYRQQRKMSPAIHIRYSPKSLYTTIPKKGTFDSECRYKIVDQICVESNLYKILGVEKTCSSEELRRAYIQV